MNLEIIDFEATDGVLNDGYINKNNSKKVLIHIHGMSSNCFKKRDKIILNKLAEENIDYFTFNNRGSDLVKYARKNFDGKIGKIVAGTTFEEPLDSYHDIKGAILKAIELGYTEIYLQGHSLGATKLVYTYNRLKNENSELLQYIKGIILLSLIDIPKVLKIFLNDRFLDIVKFAEEKQIQNKGNELMPNGSFIHPVSVNTFLRYAKYNEEIDFAQYSNKDYNFELLNNISIPLFMRWGNVNEMIEQNANDLVQNVNSKLNNSKKDINYIDGADHGYHEKEDILAKEIIDFIKNI